ncbi:MAG: hypothetical protein PHH60_02775, partial [Candidatus Margulisbacteria bacterium]|nr:hypothetical protein [Candidatus Margulisiibacteriota bacterium]
MKRIIILLAVVLVFGLISPVLATQITSVNRMKTTPTIDTASANGVKMIINNNTSIRAKNEKSVTEINNNKVENKNETLKATPIDSNNNVIVNYNPPKKVISRTDNNSITITKPPVQVAPIDRNDNNIKLYKPPVQAAPVNQTDNNIKLYKPPVQAAPVNQTDNSITVSNPPLQAILTTQNNNSIQASPPRKILNRQEKAEIKSVMPVQKYVDRQQENKELKNVMTVAEYRTYERQTDNDVQLVAQEKEMQAVLVKDDGDEVEFAM